MRHMTHVARRAKPSLALAGAVLCSLLFLTTLSACELSPTGNTPASGELISGTQTTSTTPSVGTATPSTGTAATPTVAPAAPVTKCSQVSGFSGAGTVNISPAFNEVMLPSGTVGALAQKFETNSIQFELINLCTKNFTSAKIQSYYAAGLPPTGFAQSSTFPYKGNTASACGDPYCWKSTLPTDRYVSLENIVPHGAVVTYTLRLAIVPITGTETIQGTYYGRFDASGTANDVWWEIVTAPPRQAKLVPQGSAKIVNVGVTSFTGLTYSQVKSKSYGTTALNGNASGGVLVVNDVFALIGNNGHYVKVLVTGIDASAPFNLSLKYVVYKVAF
jgi:hypothetical protein